MKRPSEDPRPTHMPLIREPWIGKRRAWWTGCGSDSQRVNPNGRCEGCGKKACPKCGYEECGVKNCNGRGPRI